ncbi:MAG: 4Fe-4S binding protein [Rectinemataceae bacterium]|nr:4Fe-4S binding protein [Rectinemataceae bacterium]
MAKRTIIEIDQDACDGCGACETGCPEGALRVLDGKARLVGESLCDGLGACIGRCPRGAIHITEREADAYDEVAVLKEILPQGSSVLQAHFAHLDHHGQDLYLERAVNYLKSEGITIPEGYERFGQKKAFAFIKPCGGGMARLPEKPSGASALKNWPIQLHLANPRAPHFAGADVVVAADCTAFALGSFHTDIVAGKALVIACPKLDSGREIYLAKLADIIRQAASVSVVIMEVPCCSGLLRLVQEARQQADPAAGVGNPIQVLVVGIDGGFVARKTI